MNLKEPGMRAPLVDIVFPCEETDFELALNPSVRKLIGALQRRFWDRRRQMLQSRALGVDEVPTFSPEAAPSGLLFTDLGDPSLDWDARLSEYRALVDESARIDLDVEPLEVRVRGWEETEAGILVDGRAVPGCIVDLAVALVHNAEVLRSGVAGFVIHVPNPADSAEAKLWEDLANVAQDRLGVERGTLVFVVDGQSLFEAIADQVSAA